jgi:hypothetical protein
MEIDYSIPNKDLCVLSHLNFEIFGTIYYNLNKAFFKYLLYDGY